MENPFETIETRLANIESLLHNLQNQEQPSQESKTEQPISQPEAVKFLGKSRQTLTAWRKKGIISAHLLGGRVYFLKSELLEAMK